MQTCDTCGNEYDHMLQITYGGNTYMFDCFECAINKLAPRCANCGTRVVGHGVETDDTIYCGAHCARENGVGDFVDRARA